MIASIAGIVIAYLGAVEWIKPHVVVGRRARRRLH
jgi:hypothetical protein